MTTKALHGSGSMKPFNLEAEKSGKPVITRDSREARIVFFDLKSHIDCIVALILSVNGGESIQTFCAKGQWRISKDSATDLFMKTETVTRWINVYPLRTSSKMHVSRQEADCAASLLTRIAC